ncbi:hypothetical protein OC834_007062 [Tilletia horrida]|nr:hypothetical protein OC834_007062 [Tilletia horrida]
MTSQRSIIDEVSLFSAAGSYILGNVTRTAATLSVQQATQTTPADFSRWMRFLSDNEAASKGSPSLCNLQNLPHLDHPSIRKAFHALQQDPCESAYNRILQEVDAKGDTQKKSNQQLEDRPSEAFDIQKEIKSPELSSKTQALRPFRRPDSSGSSRIPTQPLSTATHGTLVLPKQKARSPEYKAPSTIVREDTAPGSLPNAQPLMLPAHSDPGIRTRSMRERSLRASEGTENAASTRCLRGAEDTEDANTDSSTFSLYEDDDGSPVIKGKRKSERGKGKDSVPGSSKKKLKARHDPLHDLSARAAAKANSSRGLASHASSSTTGAGGDICDERSHDGDGTGKEDIIALRRAAKVRLSSFKEHELQDWRHSIINKVQSPAVLYYWDLVEREQRGSHTKYTWRCRCCHTSRSTTDFGNSSNGPGKTSNLTSHIHQMRSANNCPKQQTPLDSTVRPYTQHLTPSDMVDISPGSSSKPDDRQKQRQAALAWMVMTTQPFDATSHPHFRAMVGVSGTSESPGLPENPKSLLHELEILLGSLRVQAIAALKTGIGLFTLQHDVWTTPSRRDAFFALHASWIDDDWNIQTACLAFERLPGDRTGATFAKRIADILDADALWDHWSGIVVSDPIRSSSYVDVLMGGQIAERTRALSTPARERLLPFSIARNTVFCFAHGLNRVVIDALRMVGAHTIMAKKHEEKVLRLPGRTNPTACTKRTLTQLQDAFNKEYLDLQVQVDQLFTESSGPLERSDEDATPDEAARIAVGNVIERYQESPFCHSPGAIIPRLQEWLCEIAACPTQRAHLQELISVGNSGQTGGQHDQPPDLRSAVPWTTFLHELRKCLEIKPALETLPNTCGNSHDPAANRFSNEEWGALKALCGVLERAEAILLDLDSAQNSVADTLFFHNVLESSLQTQLDLLATAAEDSPTHTIRQAMEAMRHRLQGYRADLVKSEIFVGAALIHPQRRGEQHSATTTEQTTAQLLHNLSGRFYGREHTVLVSPPVPCISRSNEAVPEASQDSAEPSSPTVDASREEVQLYLSDRLPWANTFGPETTTGALAWWKQYAHHFPQLSILARTLLAIPASTAVTEHAFAQTLFFCPTKHHLGADSIPMLTASALHMLNGVKHTSETP